MCSQNNYLFLLLFARHRIVLCRPDDVVYDFKKATSSKKCLFVWLFGPTKLYLIFGTFFPRRSNALVVVYLFCVVGSCRIAIGRLFPRIFHLKPKNDKSHEFFIRVSLAWTDTLTYTHTRAYIFVEIHLIGERKTAAMQNWLIEE